MAQKLKERSHWLEKAFSSFLSSIIYLSMVLCLCVCVCVTICCGTLCYSFSFNNQTDSGDKTEGLERVMDGEIGKGQIGEGGCEETFLCLSLN